MATEVNILEDSSAVHAEEEDRHSKVAQFDSIPDESAPAGSIVNQTLTKLPENENENEHKKQVEIHDADTGSKKNEVISDFNVEKQYHDIANDAKKISKLSCAEESEVKIHAGETSTDTRSLDQHVEEIISERMEKEIITSDKDEISRLKGEKDSDLEECREQATSIIEADLGVKNDDNVRVEESCIKDEDIDNKFSNNSKHVEVEGKDIESFRSSNKFENELERDKTEDASINVAETPSIHHGEEATPEAVSNNEDDNNNKLENQASDLATDEVSTLGVAPQAGESLKEASSESCIEVKKDIHESKWQDIDVPPVDEINKIEDSTLLKCNEGGENGEDTAQIGLVETNKDREINPEKDNADKGGSWKKNEQQEKLEGDFVLIPEKSEISAAGENVEISTEKLHPDYEEKEEKEEPASTSNSEETLSSTEKNLPLVESITQSASAEVEFPEKNGNDLNPEYVLVEKTREEDCSETVEVKTEAQEENQELSEPHAHHEEETQNQSEAQSKDIVSEDSNSEGAVIKEIILQSNEAVKEHVNSPESSKSDEKIEIKRGGKIIPDNAKETEEDTDIQTQKSAAESVSEDEATSRDGTIEQSFQEESPKDAEPTSIDSEIHRPENDAERNTKVLEAFDQPKTTAREEISAQHIMSGPDEETIIIFPVDENKSQNMGEGTSAEVEEENNVSNLPLKFTETDKNISHESNQNVESPDEVLDISLKKQEESVLGEFSEKIAEDEDKDANIKPICEEYSKKMLQNDEKEKVEEVADITTDGSKAGASGENPESTDSIAEEETTTSLEKISQKEEKIKSIDDRNENEAENQEVQVFETTEASQATTESILEVCEKSKTDAPKSKPQSKEMENTAVRETLSSVPVDLEQGKEFPEEDESCETKIKEEVEETSLTDTKVTDTSDDFSEPKEDNDALNTEENNNSLGEVSTSTLGVFENDDFSIKDSEAASIEDVSGKTAMKEVKSLNDDQLEASDASPDMEDSTTIETKENSSVSVDSDKRKDQEADREENRGMEVPEVADERGQQISHDINDQALTTSTPLLEVQLEQTFVGSDMLPSKEDHKTMDQTLAGDNDSYVAAETPSVVNFEGLPDNKKDNADEEIDHKNTVEDLPIEQRDREKVTVLSDQNEANKLDIVEGEKSTIEPVASTDSENGVLEEEELAKRTEDSPEVVVVERGQEETTAALERISLKENIEENNNNLVEIFTSTLGVFKKDDLNTNDSEAVSVEDVSEKPAMKEVRSLNEEQPEISDAPPDIKDLTTTETKADSSVSVDIDESKQKETESEENREVEVPEVEDESRQQISHDIKGQALNTDFSDKITTTALLEVQLEQTLADSDMVPSKEDSKTIETGKTIAGDDALYIDAETPFIARFEGSSDDKKENADEEFDQKNMVEDQSVEQREGEQVMVLGDQNEANKLDTVEDEKSTVAVSKHVEVVTGMNSENSVPEGKELAERTEESSEVVAVEREGQEETIATLEKILQKENIEEKVTDETKENEAENQEVQVLETTQSSQATTENILEVCKRPKTDSSESKTEDKDINNTVESETLPSVSVRRMGENESLETKIKEEVEATITNTPDDFSDSKEDSDALNTEQNLVEVSTSSLGASEKDDFSINNSEAGSLKDVSEKPAMKEVKSLHEEQLEASDASPDMKDFTTNETAANGQGSVDIDERKEKETNTEEFEDITTEGSKADASGENLESTEFTAEEETTTTREEISQKEGEEKRKSIDDDTKENESENQEVQVLVTAEESQGTAENILEVYEKSRTDALESKQEDREIKNTVGSGTLSSVSVDTEKGKEFPEENECGDIKMKEEVEETSLTETKVTDTVDNFSELKEDIDALTTEEDNNKLVETSTSTLGVSEKFDHSTNDSEGVLLGDASEKPATKEVKSIDEEKPEISDASPDMTDLTTIETKANSLSSVDIDEMKEKETDIEEKQDMEVPVVADEGDEEISHDTKDKDLTTGTPPLEVQLEQTFVDSDMVLSKEDHETTETSMTTDKTIAGDDVSHIDGDTASVAHVEGSADNKKDDADEEIDEKNTAEDLPKEPKEREQVTALADQNEANELEIDKDEKSAVEVSKHIEVVRSMNSESAVPKEEELAERTEDSSAVLVVEREGQEEIGGKLERISQKENIEEKVTARDDNKENEAASQEVLLVTNVGSEATAENILKVEVTNAEFENQTEATNLADRNISNASDDIPEPKEDHGASTTEQNKNNLEENSSSISEVFEKHDNSTNGSDNESVRVVSENTAMKEGNKENEDQPKGSDAAPDMKDVTAIETKAISLSSFNNDERQEEESSSENVPAVVEEVISHEPHKLEICKDEKPTVELSEHTEVSTGVNNESALREEEELSEITDRSPAPAVIGEEKEAAEPKAGSPSSEEEPAITKNSEILIEKSLQSDESERSELAENKHKVAMIKLKDDLTNANDGEGKVEALQDMNSEASKEETKITVEKISQMEEIEEKEVRSTDDTKETGAAYQEIPVTDAAGQATGENNFKVCELGNTEASVSKPQEEIENIVGALPSASVGTETGKQHPHVNTDDTMLQQEVEVTYVESAEQIKATSLIERKTSISSDSYLEPKEDHGSLTTEENNNNPVDNASPTAGVHEKDESNIIDSETEILGATNDKTTMECDKPVNEEQLEGSDVATQTKDAATIEREEEETDSEENKNMEVPEMADEGLQQESHQIEEKSEITGLDHEKESTINTPQLDEQLVQTYVESSVVPPKGEPEITEPSKTAEDTPATDEKEMEDGRDRKHKDEDEHMPPDLKTEKDILDTEDIEQLQTEQLSGLEDQNETGELEIVKDEMSSVGLEEKIAARTEDNSAIAGVEREAAELKEGTPSSEEEPAGTKSSELLAEKISVTDGASQATGENSSEIFGTSNTEVSVSKPQEEIENIVGTIPSVPVEIQAGKEYPQVHTGETKLQQEVKVTDAESSKEQIEATSLIERQFSCTSDSISELKEDPSDLTTEENNNNLVDNASTTARVFEKDESNVTDSETELIGVTSDKTILKDDKPGKEDQLEGSDAATQTKDVTAIETKNSSSVSNERQEEETNLEENKIIEVPEVEDEGLQKVSHHMEEKVEITGLDHEKESTASTPQLDEQLVPTEIDSNMVPTKEEPETIESSKTTEEKSTVEVSKDIEVVTSTNDRTVVVEEEELAERTEGNSAVAGVEREATELNEGSPSSEEEPAKTKSSELQVEKVEDMNRESKEQNEVTFLIERNLSNTLDDLSEPKEDRGALTTEEENNVDFVHNSFTSVGVSEKDKSSTNESSVVSSKEEAKTNESSKATEDNPAGDEEREREDDKNKNHSDQDTDMPSDLKTENDILDTEDIEQLKREKVVGLEDQNEASELEIVKDEKSSVEVPKDIEVVTCIDTKNVVLEEEEIAARTEDNSTVGGVEGEAAELKVGAPSTEEDPTKIKTRELQEEKVEFTYEDDKPVNEDQVEVCDAATDTKDVTSIKTEANSSIVNDGERQEEDTNSEENRNTEVPQVTDEGGQKISDDIKEKDIITCVAYEIESTISTPLLDEQLAQTNTDSSMVSSKEDQESVRSSKTTEEISKGAPILASSDNEKESADGGDQKYKDQDQLISPDQESNNDTSDADQNKMHELEIPEDEKLVGEMLEQIKDATCIKAEETVLTEERTEQTKDSSAVTGVEEEPAELKEGSPISEEEPTNRNNTEFLLEKGHHTVETTDNGSIKEELKEQGTISAEEGESTEVEVLDSDFKQYTEATELTEVKESVTLEDHTKQNINTIDISSSTSTDVLETGNKDSSSISKVYEREAAAEVLKKDESTVDDTKHMSVTVAIEETQLKNVVPEHEQQDKGSDFATENESVTRILTQTTTLNDKEIHERQEESFSKEKKGILEEADSCHLKTDHCAQETDISTSLQHEGEVTDTTDKAEETHVTEHTTENKLLQNELEVAKKGVSEVETEKSNASENILEQTPELESNAMESDAVSAADNTVTEVTSRNSESIKQIESLNNSAKANEDVSSLTTTEASEEETCGEESKQTLLRDSDNEKQKADGEEPKHMDQDELMPPDLKTDHAIPRTEGIEQCKSEQVSGLADQNEACELEPVKVEKSTVEVPKDVEVVTGRDGKHMLKEQDLTQKAEENSAAVGVEGEAAELEEGTDTADKAEETHVTEHTTENKLLQNELEVAKQGVSEAETEKSKASENIGEQTPVPESNATEFDAVSAADNTVTEVTSRNSESIKQFESLNNYAKANEDASSLTTIEASEEETCGEESKQTLLRDSDNEKQKADGEKQKHMDEDELMPPDLKPADVIPSTEDIEQCKSEQVSGLADQNEACELEPVKVKKSTVEVPKDVEVVTGRDGKHMLKEQDLTQRDEENSAAIGVEGEAAELEEGSDTADKAEETHVTEHTIENKLLQNELDVAKQGVSEAETEKSKVSENIGEQTPVPERNATEFDAVSAADNTVTEVTSRNSESMKQIESLNNYAKANEDVSSLTTIEASEEKTCGEESKQTLLRDSDNEKQEADGEEQKHMDQDELMPLDLKPAHVIPSTEDIEQWKREQVSGLADQNEACELEPVKVEKSTVEVPKDVEVVTSTDGKHMLKEQDLTERAEENSAAVGVEEEAAELEEGSDTADKAEETHVTEHTTENKLLQNELEVAKQGVSEVETEKSNASENIIEQTPVPESNATEFDAVSAADNTVTEVTSRHSESIKQIESLNNSAKANEDVSSLTTIEVSEEETCGEESRQTLLRDSDNEKPRADGEEPKHMDQYELMPPDLKTAHVIPSTEDIEQCKGEQVSGLADQNEACELEPVEVEKSTVEVPKDVEVVTSTDGKHMLEDQDLAERAEENSAAVGVEGEAAELEEGTLSCEDKPVKTNSSELQVEKVEVIYEESKKQKGALDDLPEPKEGHGAYTTEKKNDNLVDSSSPSVEVLEKEENSTNDSNNAAIEDGKPVNEDQVEVSDAATETKDVKIIETEAHSSVNNDERQAEETVNSKEDQGSMGSSKTSEETAERDDSSYVDAKTASFEISEGDSILENSDNKKEIVDGGSHQHKDQDQHKSPDPKFENDVSDTADIEQWKTEQDSGLAHQNGTCELEVVKDEKSVDEVSKHIEDATGIKGEETVLEKDEHTGRAEDSPAVTGVEGESAEPKGSPISEEEPTNTKNSELPVEKVHHTETADNESIKEEPMEHSIISAEEERIEVRVSNLELKQHTEAIEMTEEKESIALEDHTEASETCNEESSSITKVYVREAEAEVLKKDELTTDDDTKHVSVTVPIEETGSKDVAPEHEEQDKGSEFATENESVTTITTESTVLNDKDISAREGEDSSMGKKGFSKEDDCRLETDYCVEETDKTSTIQHEREVTTSSVLHSQDYSQQLLEVKDIYVTEEITNKAAETHLTGHTTENKSLKNEHEVAKEEGVFEVKTEKSNASENILEQTTELESNVGESDAVSSADKTVNEGTATTSQSIKQIESLENFSGAIEDVSSFTTIEASQEETQGKESKKTLFGTSSVESCEADKDTKAEIIRKEEAGNISEILPRALVGEDIGLNETIGEDKNQENNFAPATEARDVTSTDGIQEKSYSSEKNGEKQSSEIADKALQEMHEDIRDKAHPKRVEHEEDSSFTPILRDNLQSSLVTQAEEEVSFTNAESTFVMHAMEENQTESNPDVIKPEVSAELGIAIIEKEREDVIQKLEDADFNRPHMVNNQTTKSDTKDVEITRTEEDSSSTAQSEACTLEKEEEPCIKAPKHRTDGTFTDDEKVVENLRSSLNITEGWEAAAASDSDGQSNNHDSTKFEEDELSAEKDHLIQDSTSEDVESIPRQQFPSEKEEKIETESEVEHHLNIPSNKEETSASSPTTKEVHSGFNKAGGNESNDKIKEQIVDSEVKLMELQILSARDEAADEVNYSNLSSTETLKEEDSNKQTMIVESSIKDDHPTTKGPESATKALEEDTQNESSRRPTEVPIVALKVVEQEMEKDIEVEEDNYSIMTHTAPVEVLKVESSPKGAQLDDKALKRSDLDDQRPETIKSLQAEEVIGEKDEMASSSLIAQTPPKVHGNADACEENLAAENVNVDQGDEFMQTYEVVSKDEIIADELLQTGDDEKFQNQTSASLERKEEQGIQVTSENTEENSKAVETLDHNSSDSKTAEETCLEKEDSMKFIDHISGTKIYEGSPMDSSSKSQEKGETPDVILEPYEKGAKECIDSLSASQKITDETKPEEAFNLKTSEKAFEYAQEVHSDKAVIELEDREYPIKTAITDLQPEENQSEKTTAAEKTTNTQVLDEKINEEKEGGKFFLRNILSKPHQENDPEAVDPFKKTKETFQTINNVNQHEVKSEALKKDEVEIIEDKLPCDVEGKNITEAARSDNENQDAEINVTTREVLMSQSEEESGVKRAKGHITVENENAQGIKKLDEGSTGKADVESKQVPQVPNEETRQEVSPENAESGRAIGIGIILEGKKVGEEKIKHLGDVLTKKSTSIDAEKTSNISEKSTEQPPQAAIHLDEATDKAVSTEKDQTQKEEKPHVEDDNIEVVSGATEIVKSSKDVEIKVAHKKHHNILSGVGSKVKHSISKVKKAITGKSSHSKSSPK